ncbi:MAG: hypothetical protein HRU17_11450 [Polyangiaceae bacterium]|nr:hypothetical protein [Polyangiaceae bacterium]
MWGARLARYCARRYRVWVSPERVWLHHASAVPEILPSQCACCGLPASQVSAEGDSGWQRLVPYCDYCLGHASRPATRQLGAWLASTLLAVTASATFPLIWPWSSWAIQLIVVLLLTVTPVGLERWWPPSRAKGHVAAKALWLGSDGLVRLPTRAVANGWLPAGRTGQPRREPGRRRDGRGVIFPLALAALLLPVFHRLHHPPLRVLNLSREVLSLEVDGRSMGTLQPSSSESVSAGLHLRLPSGSRQLLVRNQQGAVLAETRAELLSGAHHLYAPLSPHQCFWIEQMSYGRAKHPKAAMNRALGGHTRFWVLPDSIDIWFAPLPQEVADGMSSGGVVSALRHALCVDVPELTR